MRKTTLMVAICLAGLVFAGCNRDDGAAITMLFYSPELQGQYADMAAAYFEVTGVRIDVQVIQGEFRTLIASRINAGDAPDVFMSNAYADNLWYRDIAYDLTDRDFMRRISPAALEGVTLDGRITGYPFLVQTHSFLYNKAIFRELGIAPPKTLAELETAAATIRAAGIQPFATGFAEWWVLPQTAWRALAPAIVNNHGGFANFVGRLNDGTLRFADVPEMGAMFDLLDLIGRNGGPRPLQSDFNDQTSMFATGRAAIIHQGNWAEETILQTNPGVEIGFMAVPVSGSPSDAGLMFDSNQTLRVYKNGRNVRAVLDWLRWLTTSEYGMNWIPGRIRQISPIAGASAPDSRIAEQAVALIDDGVPSFPWFYQMFPPGSEETLGLILQSYVAGIADRAATLSALDDAYARLVRAAR